MTPGVSRRGFLRGSAAATLCAVAVRGLGASPGAAPVEYPFRVLADGLRFPEGPVALADGSVLIVEIARGTLGRVPPEGGAPEVVARLGGGPNGAALGPDGRCYVCNNGGDEFAESGGILLPAGKASDYQGGCIQRVDLDSGQAEILYDSFAGKRLSAPNDLVFDASGGFWFTDIGKSGGRSRDHGAIYYAKADGSAMQRAVHPLDTPNGIALSPDGGTLYVSKLLSGRLIAFEVSAPGKLAAASGIFPGRFVGAGPGRYLFDSMALEANGNICVAAPLPGEILRFRPGGALEERVGLPGPLPTNLCFGGADQKTAYVTLSGEGQLIAVEWPERGLRLPYSPEPAGRVQPARARRSGIDDREYPRRRSV